MPSSPGPVQADRARHRTDAGPSAAAARGAGAAGGRPLRGRSALFVLVLLALAALGPPARGAESAVGRAMLAGRAALEEGDLPRALVQWSLALSRARGAGDRGAEAESLLHLGAVHRRLRRHADARGAFEEAARIERSLGNPVGEAAALHDLGLVDLDLGAPEPAARRFERAFGAFREAGDPLKAAGSLLGLGIAEGDLGQLRSAVARFEAALSLFEAARDDRGVADALNARGAALRLLGRLGPARDDLDRAAALYRRVGDASGELDALHNLAAVLQDAGEAGRAAELYAHSRDALRARGDPEGAAAAALGAATVLHAAGDLDGARAAYDEALELASRAGDEGIEAAVELDMGVLALARGDHRGARSLLSSARDRASSRRDHAGEARASLALGRVFGEIGEEREARRALQRAVELTRGELLPEVRWRALHLLGRSALAKGDPETGIARLREAVEVIEALRDGHGADEPADAGRFLASRASPYEDLVGALLATGDSLGAFLYSERLQVADLRSGLPADDGGGDLVARYDRFAGRDRALSARLQEALGAAEPERDPERVEALREGLRRSRIEFSAFVDDLRESSPDLASAVRVDPDDLQATRRALPADVAVLQPMLVGERLVLLVFTRESLAFEEPPVEARKVEQAVSRTLRALRSQDRADLPRLKEDLGRLHGWLVAPVAQHLARASTLLVCPGGALRYLPFAALWDGERWLGETHAVATLTHVGSIRGAEGDRAPFRLRDGALLAMGDPDGTLPSAAREVEALRSAFPAGRFHLGAGATREALARDAPGRAVVHLATHGVLDASDPPSSFILLAGEGEAARLSYREIPALADALGTAHMVVLSACETGIGIRGRGEGGEGREIAGLAHQFRRAGAPTLVASLWKVSDDGTGELMKAFYAELAAGAGRAVALARAQRKLLRDERFAHPYHWGAFVVIGDWT
ncbi:CHAT domain-containing protein [Myxococcota bacterium]|nr:CHAT domain-containing protein [Myxococcota bacterium]